MLNVMHDNGGRMLFSACESDYPHTQICLNTLKLISEMDSHEEQRRWNSNIANNRFVSDKPSVGYVQRDTQKGVSTRKQNIHSRIIWDGRPDLDFTMPLISMHFQDIPHWADLEAI